MMFFAQPYFEAPPSTRIEFVDSTPGSGQDANYLERIVRQKDSTVPVADRNSEVINALLDAYSSCRNRGWDGYDAEPVSRNSLEAAYRLADRIPYHVSLPEIGAEPDGNLTMEWYTSPSQLLNLSISSNGKLHYAAIFADGSSHYGTENGLSGFPFILKVLIEKVMER